MRALGMRSDLTRRRQERRCNAKGVYRPPALALSRRLPLAYGKERSARVQERSKAVRRTFVRSNAFSSARSSCRLPTIFWICATGDVVSVTGEGRGRSAAKQTLR